MTQKRKRQRERERDREHVYARVDSKNEANKIVLTKGNSSQKKSIILLRGNLCFAIHYFSHSSPQFSRVITLCANFWSDFHHFRPRNDEFYGLFCCFWSPPHVMAFLVYIAHRDAHFQFSSSFATLLHIILSSVVTKSTWLLTYRLVVKLFLRTTIENIA